MAGIEGTLEDFGEVGATVIWTDLRRGTLREADARQTEHNGQGPLHFRVTGREVRELQATKIKTAILAARAIGGISSVLNAILICGLQRHGVGDDGVFFFFCEKVAEDRHASSAVVYLEQDIFAGGRFGDRVGEDTLFQAFERGAELALVRGGGMAEAALLFEQRLAVLRGRKGYGD